MYKKSFKRMKAILKSLQRGASINEACKGAGVDVHSLWRWRKLDKKLDELIKSIYDSRIQIVEDALYKGALEGNVTSQIFFLKNRATNRWRDQQDIKGEGFGGDTKIIIVHTNKDVASARDSSDSETLPVRVSVEPSPVPIAD